MFNPEIKHNLEDVREALLAPRDTTKRQAGGVLYHPDLPILGEGARMDLFLAAIGLETAVVFIETDAPNLSEWIADESKGFTLADWTPTPPLGENWVLIEIHDTEDDAVALFVRPESGAEYRDRMHSNRYPAWVNDERAPYDASSGIVSRAHRAGLDQMRDWMLKSLPSALRMVVRRTSYPPLPLWVRAWRDEINPAYSVDVIGGYALWSQLDTAARWIENGNDPLQAAEQVRLVAAVLKDVPT